MYEYDIIVFAGISTECLRYPNLVDLFITSISLSVSESIFSTLGSLNFSSRSPESHMERISEKKPSSINKSVSLPVQGHKTGRVLQQASKSFWQNAFELFLAIITSCHNHYISLNFSIILKFNSSTPEPPLL
ncbi:hypothetical protein Ahy_A03g013674 isoform A [Arachis hypogaea]|uniref:Uncharacterized protein n=1 Tax=Arachis hypogaea TaxID=3818 RepID=A0A445DVY1_ARAHY|nr:hypothetical protein Ahy_A03g013674 isoform A [Arachis hypogaea]